MKPIITCDVSKNKSHIRGYLNPETPLDKAFKIQHVKSGFKEIKSLAEKLKSLTGLYPVFVLEDTGVYSECVKRYVESIGLDLYSISPLESAKQRKAKIRVTKTDPLDCDNIAKVYYSRNLRKSNNTNQNTKNLARSKESLTRQITTQKCIISRYLDLIRPCIEDFFGDFDKKWLYVVIKQYGHPEVLKRRTVDQIASLLMHQANKRKLNAYRIAHKLKDYALEVVSGIQNNDETINQLVNSIKRLEGLTFDRDVVNFQLNEKVKKYPIYEVIKHLPCVGENLLLSLSSELLNIDNYKSPKQLVAYAGLDPSILQSGKENGEHYSITKKGNGLLRSKLYLLVKLMLSNNKDNVVTRFYSKKKNSGLPNKAAVIATCRKLLTVIYGMNKNKTFILQ